MLISVPPERRRLWISSVLLLMSSVLLLGGTAYLGWLVLQQVRSLEANVQVTENIINANVRTLGQVQRELLRLLLLLESGANDPEALDLQRAFVSQRMQEATLSYQLQTLGAAELLQAARDLSGRWTDEVEPLIRAIQADPADDDGALRLEAGRLIRELEQGFNRLVTEGEINRKQQAGLANDTTIRILTTARTLLTGFAVTLGVFLIFVGLTAFLYYRFDRQRDATARHLVQLNAEMRKLSQVASRTDNMVVITDAEGGVEWVNDAFTRVTDYMLDEIAGKHPVALLQGADTDPATVAQLMGAIRLGEGYKGEVCCYSKAGRDYWASIEIRPVGDEKGRLSNFIAIIGDLTEQRQREETISQNSQLLNVINKAQREFILTNAPGPLFEELLANLLELTHSEYGFIGEVLHTDEGKPFLKTHAITNIAWSAETQALYEAQAAGGMEFYNLRTLFGAAMLSREPVIANDPATDPRRGGMPAGHPSMNAFLGVPFFNPRQEMVGLIGIANRPSGYDEQLVEFLQPFLATCGNLIEAYRNEKRRQAAETALVTLNEELEDRVVERTAALTKVQERYQSLFQEAPIMYLLTEVRSDGQPIITDCNDMFLTVMGYPREKVIDQPLARFYSPSSQTELLRNRGYERAMVEKLDDLERQLVRSDGHIIDALLYTVPETDATGSIIGTRAAYVDISDRKRIQKALEEERQMLARRVAERTAELQVQRDFALQIMNNMGQGLTVVDEDGRFSFVNPAFAAMVNEHPDDLIGRDPFEFTRGDYHDDLSRARINRVQGKITTYESRIRRHDGQDVDVLITGVPRYRDEQYAGSIAVITDLTEQKRAEAALRRSEAEARKLSQVASRTDNLVIIADADGNVEWVNTAFTRVTGYALEEVTGKRPGDLLQGPDTDLETVHFMRQRLRQGKGFNCEILNYAKDGREYWVAIEVQPVHDESGQLTNFIAIESDITERRQAEAHLRQAKEAAEQAAHAKAAFLASMSHEIRTPLNAVIGLNSLLLNTDLTERQRDFAETARNSGNLLLMLINNVLDFSAFESGNVELEEQPFSLEQSLQELIGLLRHEASQKHLKLICQVSPAIPPVLVGDEIRLRQVLLNLVGNSIKFTEAGEIQVSVSPLTQGKQVTLQFSVQDSGIGIPADRVDRLFQPFSQVDASTTRRFGGSGLGLAISKMIVNMMGGEIWVESEPGQGTTFYFTVQLATGDRSKLSSHARPLTLDEAMGHTWPLRILLVEDDAVNQQVAIHMLDQLGYRADVAANGLEAIDALKRQRYDLVFMDVHMPGMDGVTATRRIHDEWPDDEIPTIVAMTASALEGDRERFMAAGMDDYISKPIQLETIASTLARFAPRGRASAPGREAPAKMPDPAGEGNDGVAPIDLEAAARRLGPGQEALISRLVELFVTEARESMTRLEAAIASGDDVRVRELGHHLKGSGAGASAARFAEIAHQLELQASQKNLTGAADLYREMARELAAVIRWQKARA